MAKKIIPVKGKIVKEIRENRSKFKIFSKSENAKKFSGRKKVFKLPTGVYVVRK
jgi:hypothetical protein|tara:strand:+ start:4286 stop:4447 length:162 start_codon:yes stop_codon:yes gene_type:complete